MAAYKPWMTHTHPLWCDIHFWWQKNGRKHPDLVVLCENRWKMAKQWKMGNYLLGQSAEWYKINAIVQVLSTRNFWYPTRPSWILHAILARGDRFALYGAVGSSLDKWLQHKNASCCGGKQVQCIAAIVMFLKAVLRSALSGEGLLRSWDTGFWRSITTCLEVESRNSI